jgi:hypothetical protein
MPRTGDVNHVQVIFPDDTIQVNPCETLAGIGAPMPKQPILAMLGAQRFSEQRIVPQVDHSSTKIIASSPVRVDLAKLVRSEYVLVRG